MKRLPMTFILALSLGAALQAQQTDTSAPETTPEWDAGKFIMKTHLHQISGITTIALATLTSAAGIALAAGNSWSALPGIQGGLGVATAVAGAATLGLGLTAFHDRLDTVWPHVMFMGLAETGFVLDAFVLKPGTVPNRITGAAAFASLGLGLVSIIIITAGH